MNHGFTFFVLLSAAIVFFIEELTEYSKKLWSNLLFRNSRLMFFIAFFSFAYQYYVKLLFVYTLGLIKNGAKVLLPFMPFQEYASHIALIITVLLGSILATALWVGFYFIAKRKRYPHISYFMGIFWLLLISMVFTVIYT